MGKRTILTAENFTVGTGNVLAAFQTAAAGSAASFIKISKVEISQSGSSTNAMIRAALSKRDTAGTLTTTSTTPTSQFTGGSASGLSGNTSVIGATGRSGTNSSADSGGTYTDICYFNFSNLNGLIWKPDYDEQGEVPASTVWVVRLLATPGSTSGWTVAVYLDEKG